MVLFIHVGSTKKCAKLRTSAKYTEGKCAKCKHERDTTQTASSSYVPRKVESLKHILGHTSHARGSRTNCVTGFFLPPIACNTESFAEHISHRPSIERNVFFSTLTMIQQMLVIKLVSSLYHPIRCAKALILRYLILCFFFFLSNIINCASFYCCHIACFSPCPSLQYRRTFMPFSPTQVHCCCAGKRAHRCPFSCHRFICTLVNMRPAL